MKEGVWERSKKKQFQYQPRHPENTSLYKLVYNYRDELEHRWSELFEHKYGMLREEVLKAFDEYLNCGLLLNGVALAECEDCPHYKLIAFSCKTRGICSSCGAKRSCIFAENLHENVLLHYAHAHQVFAIPKRLRIYFKFNRRLNKYLFLSAWHAWKTYVARRIPDARTGSVMALHTNGDLLEWHPHLHCASLLGAVDREGEFHELPAMNTEELEKLFSEMLFGYLLEEELIEQEVIDNMKSWEHSGFNAFSGDAIGPEDADQRRFVGRYLMKPSVSGERLEINERGLEPRVVYTKQLNDGERRREFSPLEFLAELSLQIPKKWEQLSRHYGLYSCRVRGERRKKEEKAQREREEKEKAFDNLSFFTPEKNIEVVRKPTSLWQACMKRIFELDPLECEKCGGRMRIKSFIFDPKEIKRISKRLGLADWRAPPSLKEQSQQEPYVDTAYAQ